MKKPNPRAHSRGRLDNNISSALKGRKDKNKDDAKSHELWVLRRAEKFRRCDEYRHDQTRQRRFELAFESRDLAESQAAIEGAHVTNNDSALVAGHGAPLFGRRTFSLISPADIAMFVLDFESWADSFRLSGRHDLLRVLLAMASGATAEEIGISERTFRRRVRQVEKILAATPTRIRLGL